MCIVTFGIARGKPMRMNPSAGSSKKKPKRVDTGVSPSVEGFFRVPPIWVGEAPPSDAVEAINPSVHHETVSRRAMRCGISVRIRRDGLFMFDFTDFAPGGVVEIPRFDSLLGQAFAEVRAAENKAEDIAVFRAQIINAFQACLETAGAVHGSGASIMGEPVNFKETVKTISIDYDPPYSLDVRYPNRFVHAIANKALGSLSKAVFPPRRTFNLASVEAAVDLLDNLLSSDPLFAVDIVEAAYIAAIRFSEKRMGEAVVIGWSVCERLLNAKYEGYLDKSTQGRGQRLSRERRKKLTGRDYTASVLTEFLELSGQLDKTLYGRLEEARKARNAWAHNLDQPRLSQAYDCLRAGWQLIEEVLGLRVLFQPGPQGGVPQWSLKQLQQVQERQKT